MDIEQSNEARMSGRGDGGALVRVLSDKGEPLSSGCTLGGKGRVLTREELPLSQGGRASLFVNLSIDEMALQGEVIVKVGVDGCKFL